MKNVIKFRRSDGIEPFSDWFSSLDMRAQQSVDAYITRARLGGARNNIKRLTGDLERHIFRIAIDKGPGYRVYFSEIDSNTLLLLNGGIKKTQSRDIYLAVRFWREFHVSKQKL